MKAFLHIGTVKTGTTSIQRFLQDNKNELKKHKFYYPQSILYKKENPQHIFLEHIAKQIYIKTKNNPNNFIKYLNSERIIRTLKQEIEKNKDKTFIFSSECISFFLDIEEKIKALKLFLNYLGFDDIKIILYLRNQADLMVSLSSEDLKRGLIKASYEIKPQEHEHIYTFDYDILCSRYSDIFGKENFIPRIFQKDDFFKEDLIKDFLHILGIKDYDFIFPKNKNESLNLLGFEFLSIFNKYNNNMDDIPSSCSDVLCFYDKNLKFMPPKQSYEAYLKYFEDSNEKVRKKFFPDRERLFTKKDLSTYQENYELKHINKEHIDKIAEFSWKMFQKSKDKNNYLEYLKSFLKDEKKNKGIFYSLFISVLIEAIRFIQRKERGKF